MSFGAFKYIAKPRLSGECSPVLFLVCVRMSSDSTKEQGEPDEDEVIDNGIMVL